MNSLCPPVLDLGPGRGSAEQVELHLRARVRLQVVLQPSTGGQLSSRPKITRVMCLPSLRGRRGLSGCGGRDPSAGTGQLRSPPQSHNHIPSSPDLHHLGVSHSRESTPSEVVSVLDCIPPPRTAHASASCYSQTEPWGRAPLTAAPATYTTGRATRPSRACQSRTPA